ncbi:MAG: putative addiction module antidote protein [Acidobacteria bacterium]|nr:putative addiction module antidote protein [Acidobacteriota bacterium]
MTKGKTRPWDPAEHLETEEDMAAYLEAALEEGNAAQFAAALGDVARARGMTQLARAAEAPVKTLPERRPVRPTGCVRGPMLPRLSRRGADR